VSPCRLFTEGGELLGDVVIVTGLLVRCTLRRQLDALCLFAVLGSNARG
jgi:hypothetical protein